MEKWHASREGTQEEMTNKQEQEEENRLLFKALMYVFSKHRPHIVKVDMGDESFYVKCEYPNEPGKYYIVEYPFSGLNGIDKEIHEALATLKWIAEGNEFPT